MEFVGFATDFDGTLADQGIVPPPTLSMLEEIRRSGRRLLLVTGREIDDLLHVFPHVGLFDRVVAENGAVLFHPRTGDVWELAERPPESFRSALRRRGVPLSSGRVICSTRQPYEHAVLETIHELGLELQLIFNKGAAMVLPTGVNKATGLAAAASQLGLSLHNVAGAGDAENDHVFLTSCEIGVAVADALPALRAAADYVCRGAGSAGVAEFLTEHMQRDCESIVPGLRRHDVSLGTVVSDGRPVNFHAHRESVLVCAGPGDARATLLACLLAPLLERRYNLVLVDPADALGGVASRAHFIPVHALSSGNLARDLVEVFAKPDRHARIELSHGTQSMQSTQLEVVGRSIEHARAERGTPHWAVLADRAAPLSVGREGSVLRVTEHPMLIPKQLLADTTRVIGFQSDAVLAAAREVLRARSRPDDLRALPPVHQQVGVAMQIRLPQEGAVEQLRFIPRAWHGSVDRAGRAGAGVPDSR